MEPYPSKLNLHGAWLSMISDPGSEALEGIGRHRRILYVGGVEILCAQKVGTVIG